MKTWEARSDDAFVVSYPKAGMSNNMVGHLKFELNVNVNPKKYTQLTGDHLTWPVMT